MKKNYIALIMLLGCNVAATAATSIGITLASNGVVLRDNGGKPLSAGTAINGDGTVLQLGYYSNATTINPFAGAWVPMSGPGTVFQTTIGDEEQTSGGFKLGLVFTEGFLGFTAPAVGTPLALRFYDSTLIATSTYFNAVSDTTGVFNWVALSDPQATASLTFLTDGIVWQDGPSSEYRTTIVPEPSSASLLAMIGLGALAVRRRPN